MTKSMPCSACQVGHQTVGGGPSGSTPPGSGHPIGNIVGTSVTRLIGALLLEQHDEWPFSDCYMMLETIASLSDDPLVSLPALAA